MKNIFILLLIVITLATIVIVNTKRVGTLEKTGKEIDSAIDDLGDSVEDATDKN